MEISFSNHKIKINQKKSVRFLSYANIKIEAYSLVFLIGYEMEDGKFKERIFKGETRFPLSIDKLFDLYDEEIKENLLHQIHFLVAETEKINKVEHKEDVIFQKETTFWGFPYFVFSTNALNETMKIEARIPNLEKRFVFELTVSNEKAPDMTVETQLKYLCEEKNYVKIKQAFLSHSKDKLRLLFYS